MAQIALWTVLMLVLIYLSAFFILGHESFTACNAVSTFPACAGQFIILDIPGVNPIILITFRFIIGIAFLVILADLIAQAVTIILP